MATIPISRNYPRPLAWEDRARNGKAPDWRLVAGAVYRSLYALTHCRKLLFHKTLTPGSTTASAAGTKTPWRWQCRTGESNYSGNTVILAAEAQVLPSDSASGNDPRWRFFAGGNNSSYRRYPAVVAAPVYDDVISQHARINGLAPDTEYQCGLEVEDYGRVVSLTVWEIVPIEADSTATYVPSYQTIGNTLEITDKQHTEFATDPLQIWKHNGAHIANLVPDDEDNPWTVTSGSFVNLLDVSASTTVSTATPGINAGVQYHNPTHTDDIDAVFCVYGESTEATANNNVILKDINGTTLGTVSDFDTTPGWKSVAVVLDGSVARHKLDVQAETNDEASTLTIYAVSLYEYVA